MRLLLLAAALLTSPAALACDLSLVAPAKSVLKNPVQVRPSLAGDTLTASYSVSAPSLNAKKILGPQQFPYMFDVVELFVTFSETGFPYYEFEVSPFNQTFQVRIISHAQPFQEGIDLGLVSAAKIVPGSWTAELKIPLKPSGGTAIPGKSGEISIPFWNVPQSAAFGVRSCRKPKRRTFISRSFFSRCFNVNRSGRGTKCKDVIS